MPPGSSDCFKTPPQKCYARRCDLRGHWRPAEIPDQVVDRPGLFYAVESSGWMFFRCKICEKFVQDTSHVESRGHVKGLAAFDALQPSQKVAQLKEWSTKLGLQQPKDDDEAWAVLHEPYGFLERDEHGTTVCTSAAGDQLSSAVAKLPLPKMPPVLGRENYMNYSSASHKSRGKVRTHNFPDPFSALQLEPVAGEESSLESDGDGEPLRAASSTLERLLAGGAPLSDAEEDEARATLDGEGEPLSDAEEEEARATMDGVEGEELSDRPLGAEGEAEADGKKEQDKEQLGRSGGLHSVTEAAKVGTAAWFREEAQKEVQRSREEAKSRGGEGNGCGPFGFFGWMKEKRGDDRKMGMREKWGGTFHRTLFAGANSHRSGSLRDVAPANMGGHANTSKGASFSGKKGSHANIKGKIKGAMEKWGAESSFSGTSSSSWRVGQEEGAGKARSADWNSTSWNKGKDRRDDAPQPAASPRIWSVDPWAQRSCSRNSPQNTSKTETHDELQQQCEEDGEDDEYQFDEPAGFFPLDPTDWGANKREADQDEPMPQTQSVSVLIFSFRKWTPRVCKKRQSERDDYSVLHFPAPVVITEVRARGVGYVVSRFQDKQREVKVWEQSVDTLPPRGMLLADLRQLQELLTNGTARIRDLDLETESWARNRRSTRRGNMRGDLSTSKRGDLRSDSRASGVEEEESARRGEQLRQEQPAEKKPLRDNFIGRTMDVERLWNSVLFGPTKPDWFVRPGGGRSARLLRENEQLLRKLWRFLDEAAPALARVLRRQLQKVAAGGGERPGFALAPTAEDLERELDPQLDAEVQPLVQLIGRNRDREDFAELELGGETIHPVTQLVTYGDVELERLRLCRLSPGSPEPIETNGQRQKLIATRDAQTGEVSLSLREVFPQSAVVSLSEAFEQGMQFKLPPPGVGGELLLPEHSTSKAASATARRNDRSFDLYRFMVAHLQRIPGLRETFVEGVAFLNLREYARRELVGNSQHDAIVAAAMRVRRALRFSAPEGEEAYEGGALYTTTGEDDAFTQLLEQTGFWEKLYDLLDKERRMPTGESSRSAAQKPTLTFRRREHEAAARRFYSKPPQQPISDTAFPAGGFIESRDRFDEDQDAFLQTVRAELVHRLPRDLLSNALDAYLRVEEQFSGYKRAWAAASSGGQGLEVGSGNNNHTNFVAPPNPLAFHELVKKVMEEEVALLEEDHDRWKKHSAGEEVEVNAAAPAAGSSSREAGAPDDADRDHPGVESGPGTTTEQKNQSRKEPTRGPRTDLEMMEEDNFELARHELGARQRQEDVEYFDHLESSPYRVVENDGHHYQPVNVKEFVKDIVASARETIDLRRDAVDPGSTSESGTQALAAEAATAEPVVPDDTAAASEDRAAEVMPAETTSTVRSVVRDSTHVEVEDVEGSDFPFEKELERAAEQPKQKSRKPTLTRASTTSTTTTATLDEEEKQAAAAAFFAALEDDVVAETAEGGNAGSEVSSWSDKPAEVEELPSLDHIPSLVLENRERFLADVSGDRDLGQEKKLKKRSKEAAAEGGSAGGADKLEKKSKKQKVDELGGSATACAVTEARAEKKKKKKSEKTDEEVAPVAAMEEAAAADAAPAKKKKKKDKKLQESADHCVVPDAAPVKDVASPAKKQNKQDHASIPNVSPITGRVLSANALEILQKRRKLPCWPAKDEFNELVANHQVVVLVGETGSGKTTQMPQFLAETYAKQGKMVAVTQPRRVAAMSVATRVAEEMDVELGRECGYLIRFEDKTSDATLVKYMTDGMLLRECMTDGSLSKYSVVCLDEAHERTLSTDILFGLLKRVLAQRPELRVVVMSATLEAEKFQKYFAAQGSEVPLLTVSGRMFPVDVKYKETPTRDYVQGSVDTVLKIIEDERNEPALKDKKPVDTAGDILVFLTGEEEIETCCQQLEEQLGEESIVLPLYSSLPPQQQKKVFQTFGGRRKIVVATNVAETSITIDGVVYVVDCGLVKVKVYNPRTHVESLLVNPISKAAAKQRAGRAGRTRPGKCFRLYTEGAFKNSLLESSWPEILRTNLGSALLTLLNLGVEDVVHFDWMDPPSPECMMRALDLLLMLNAVDEDCRLTDEGRKMAEFPLDPQLGKVLLAGAKHGVTKQVAAVIALLSGAPAQMRPRQYAKAADRAHKAFASVDGDHNTLLNIFEAYQANKHDKGWAYDNYLKDRSLQSAESVQRQLLRLCEKLGVPTSDTPTTKGDTVKVAVRKAFVAGFFQHVAHISGKHYVTVRDKQIVEVHPGSLLEHKPEWILYNELVLTDKNYLRTVTALRAEWLVEEAPAFFPSQVANDEARKGLERYAKRKSG
eukprot:g14571.t1